MMTQDDYESWKTARRQGAVPPGFADRVMQSVQEYDTQRRSVVARSLMARVLQSHAVRVAACSLAVVACVLRIACVLATFWPWSTPTM